MRSILHISDIHFGPHFLPEVAEGVLQLIAEREPDLVVISGDLTLRAKPPQFHQAREFVERFAVPFLAVPGNHDVPMYRFWERFFAPYGAYRKHFSPQLEPQYRDEEMVVIGINSAFNWTIQNGRVKIRRLRELADLLEKLPSHLIKIVVVHHELIPAPRFGGQVVMRNAPAMAEILSHGGVDLVLSGHVHQSYVGTTEEYHPNESRPVPIAVAGTTTSSRGRGWESRRNTLNWIELDDDRLLIVNRIWMPESRSFVVVRTHEFPRRPSAAGPGGVIGAGGAVGSDPSSE